MEYTTDINGKLVRAWGAPNSIARAKCEGRYIETQKLPYCSGFYTDEFCKEKVAELQASNKYIKVWYTKAGRIWIEREL